MSISSLSLSNVSRNWILRAQTELRDALKVQDTGRHADIGLTLGRLTGNAVSYRAQETVFASNLETNKLVSTRLKAADDVLTALATSVEDLSNNLMNPAARGIAASTLVTEAKGGLAQLTGGTGLNMQLNGQYLFAGAQSDVQPMRDGSAALKADFDAYLSAIGKDRGTVGQADVAAYFSPAGAVVAAPADGSAAKTYRFDDNFSDDAWHANWSRASDDPAIARISASETVKTSASANDAAFRKLAAGYAAISSLGLEQMGKAAQDAAFAGAKSRLDAGSPGLTEIKADFGVRQNRITAANAALTRQQDIVKAAYENLEGVDEIEAALRVTSLKTQLDTSYAVTGRIQSLSILNYL